MTTYDFECTECAMRFATAQQLSDHHDEYGVGDGRFDLHRAEAEIAESLGEVER